MCKITTHCPRCSVGHLNFIMGAQDFKWQNQAVTRISKDENVVVCVLCRSTFPELVKEWEKQLMNQRLQHIKNAAKEGIKK